MKRLIKKICILILIFIPLFFAMWVYSSVFMDSPQKNKQSFEKYFIKHFEELQLFNISPYNKILDISTVQIAEYGAKLSDIAKDSNCLVEKVVEAELNGEIKIADKYTIMVNEKKFVSEIANVIKELLKNEEILNADIFTDEQIENFEKFSEKHIKNIENIDENNQVYISVYIIGREPVRTDFVSKDWEVSYQIANTKTESFAEFSIQQNKEKVTKYIIELTNKLTDNLAELTCEYEVLHKEEDEYYSDFYRKQNDKFVLTSQLSSEKEQLKTELKTLINSLMINTVPAATIPTETMSDKEV